MIDAKITDATALENLSHKRVLAYLLETGWKTVGHFSRPIGNVPIMQNEEDESLVVPLPEAGDYAQRLSDIIRTLSRIEQRSELDIFVDLGGDIGVPEKSWFQRLTTPGDGIS